jgi:hypothetical protein
MDTSYLERSRAETRRLAELVARLSALDLQASLGDGWTVKAALAHLAFWDRYAVAVLDGWIAAGFQPVAASPDHINAASLPGWLELPAEHVLREVVAAAEAADQRVASVTPALAEAMIAGGRGRMLDRSVHRHEHISHIEAAV